MILWLIYAVLIIPGFAAFLKLPEKPLEGAYYQHQSADFSWAGWFSGDFQDRNERYLGMNYGFHNFYVRSICELDYRIFKHPHARFVIVGKENYLYETEYIQSYYGRDYLGEDSIRKMLLKLKCVQDSMRKEKKLILPVLAAGKAWYYPEYIPDRFRDRKGNTNYNAFADILKQYKMDHVDFNAWFAESRSNTRYPLYPQLGIHWSNYGSIMMFDSLLHYIGNRTMLQLPELVIDSVQMSDSLRYPDNDVVKSLNLLTNLSTFDMAYPYYHVKSAEMTQPRPKLLVVSDSFWWYIYSTGLPDQLFDSRFWYYNEEMYPESARNPAYVKEHNYFKSIREADVIIILHTPSTLYKFGNGFIDMVYSTYCKPDPSKEQIQAVKGIILGDSAWISQVRSKAESRQISVDSMLTLDAMYVLTKKNPR